MTSTALIIALITHGAAWVWWASKISANLANIGAGINRLDRELEKRDVQISKLWDRVDEIRDLIK